MSTSARLHQRSDTLPEGDVASAERLRTVQHAAAVSGNIDPQSQEPPRAAPPAFHHQESEWTERSWGAESGWALAGATVLLVVTVLGAALVASLSAWSLGTPADPMTSLRAITQRPEPFIGAALAGGLFTLVGRDLSIRRR